MSRLVLFFIIAVSGLSFLACKKEATIPKPRGYKRIEIPHYKYIERKFQNFSFNYSELSTIQLNSSNNSDWINIDYPRYNAKIHCTYISITQGTLINAVEDSHKLAYSHAVKADNINQLIYSDTLNHVYGILYTIDGNVATPAQFFLTDSISNFFRGSFYYDTKVKSDSISPITAMVREDIKNIISSFRWKKGN